MANLYEKLDRWLHDGNYEQVDLLMEHTPVNEVTTTLLIAILAFTLQHKEKLSARKDFYRRVAESLSQEDPETAELLLQGLE